jgi:hypothetical protein
MMNPTVQGNAFCLRISQDFRQASRHPLCIRRNVANSTVGLHRLPVYSFGMSATELIEQFKALPPSERAEVAKFVVENDDSWIPQSFREGMADAESGRLVRFI